MASTSTASIAAAPAAGAAITEGNSGRTSSTGKRFDELVMTVEAQAREGFSIGNSSFQVSASYSYQ